MASRSSRRSGSTPRRWAASRRSGCVPRTFVSCDQAATGISVELPKDEAEAVVAPDELHDGGAEDAGPQVLETDHLV